MNALVIFSLLAVLMLTGMPISISLGLTVLTFLFTMTQVPLESVASKLFTGIEKFEIMAIPFFILAGNFLTHGGVAKRMINFATSHGWPLVWRSWPGRRAGLRSVRGGVRLQPGDGGGHWLHPAAGNGQGWLPEHVRGWRDLDLGRARHPDPAVHRHGDVLGRNQYLGRRPVHGRRHPGAGPGWRAGWRYLVSRQEVQLPASAQGFVG